MLRLVPIPKNGNLKRCDNWRGISLLDVFARILQERLQTVADGVLPESQCGFHKERGCVDMIFVARQLVEKCREHDESLFVLFVDLKKAYDSVPRSALRCVLEKCGVQPVMLSVIRSIHDGMKAEVRAGSRTYHWKHHGEEWSTARLHTSSITLQCVSEFNDYTLEGKVPGVEVEVPVLYKLGRKLDGDRTAKSCLKAVKITDSLFVDDTAVYATTHGTFERAASEFVDSTSKWGLTVSIKKTKGLIVGKHVTPSDTMPVQVDDDSIEVVQDFTYLGSYITSDGK